MENFEYFEKKARELRVPENEQYVWINRQIEMATRNLESEVNKLQLTQNTEESKRANQTTESRSSAPRSVQGKGNEKRIKTRVTDELRKDIIAKHQSGMRNKDIATHYKKSQSTISTIVKNGVDTKSTKSKETEESRELPPKATTSKQSKPSHSTSSSHGIKRVANDSITNTQKSQSKTIRLDMEDHSMLLDLAGKLEIGNEKLKLLKEELKQLNKKPELVTKRKPNDTSEDQSLDDVPCNAEIINPQETKEDKKVPKKRSITKKIEVIAQLEAGKTISELASEHGIPSSTISTWRLKKDEIKKKYAEYIKIFSANAQSSHPKTKKIKQSDTAEKIIQPQPEKPKEQNARFTATEKKVLFDYVVKEFDWKTAAEEMTKKGYPRTSTQLRDKIKRQLNKKNKKITKKVLLRN